MNGQTKIASRRLTNWNAIFDFFSNHDGNATTQFTILNS